MKKRNSSILIAGIIIVVILGVFIGALSLLQNVYKTETYYVLNQDISTKTQITAEMLDPVVTSDGTAPQNTIGVEEVQEGNLFAQFPLSAGDVLLRSNVSGFTDISTGIPDDYVVTSINVGADSASGGRIHRGVYFDIMVYDSDSTDDPNEEGRVFYPFVNVLALDTTVSMDSASSQDAIETEEAQSGQVSFYYMGVTPENAAYLELLSQKYSGDIKLLLSPRQNEYNKPQTEEYAGFFTFNSETGEMKKQGDNEPQNLGEEMDSTFTQLERNEFGVPTSEPNNCGDGNAFVATDPETGKCPAKNNGATETETEADENSDISSEE